MQAVQCSKGHFYDQSLGRCPQCAEEARKFGTDVTEPIYGGVDYIPNTVPSPSSVPPINNSFSSFGNFNPGNSIGETEPVTNAGFTPTDFAPVFPDNTWVVEDYDKTQANAFNSVAGFDPIVGWLVCVKGPNRGRDYRLHSGTNFIGSSKEMDVCIDNDKTISRTNAASISYDDVGRVFFIQKGDSRNLIYVNGAAVRSDADLSIYDHIIIGSTELIFIPLCCDKFTWQED